jgi:hypothetical protein
MGTYVCARYMKTMEIEGLIFTGTYPVPTILVYSLNRDRVSVDQGIQGIFSFWKVGLSRSCCLFIRSMVEMNAAVVFLNLESYY